MILVDANVLMYAAGAEHAHKEASVRCLRAVAEGRVEGVLDAEILQEVLHRYRAIGRWGSGGKVYDGARRIFSIVLPITAEVIDQARGLLDDSRRLSARDALHAAVVERFELEGICSYDRGFDRVRGLRRVEPEALLGA